MTGTLHFILGAPDPEMEAIDRLLHECGCDVTHATAGGRRVHPGNAYQADGLSASITNGSTVYTVECGGGGIPDRSPSKSAALWGGRVDHHRPGDPGYGRPPAEFLPASSIGQVISLLASRGDLCWRADTWPSHLRDGEMELSRPTGPRQDGSTGPSWLVGTHDGVVTVPRAALLVAAADHCLTAAYRGECPGVDPDDLMRWRAESRATFQRRNVADVLADVRAATAALQAAPKQMIAGVGVADLGDGTVPEAPEAAARAGIPFLAVVAERDGRRKQVLQAAPPEVIAEFMRIAGPAGYGDPARGFAGRYLEA